MRALVSCWLSWQRRTHYVGSKIVSKNTPCCRPIGFSGARIFRLVMTESVLLSIGGGLIGVGAAILMLTLSSLSVGAEAGHDCVHYRPHAWLLRESSYRLSPEHSPESHLPSTPHEQKLSRLCDRRSGRARIPTDFECLAQYGT